MAADSKKTGRRPRRRTVIVDQLLLEGADLLSQGKVESGTARASEALKLRPGNPLAQNMLGLGLIQQRKFSRAQSIFENLIRRNPDVSPLRFNSGLAALNAGDLDSALDHFRGVVDLDPAHSRAFGHLALVHLRRGEASMSQAALREAGLEALANQIDTDSSDAALVQLAEALAPSVDSLPASLGAHDAPRPNEAFTEAGPMFRRREDSRPDDGDPADVEDGAGEMEFEPGLGPDEAFEDQPVTDTEVEAALEAVTETEAEPHSETATTPEAQAQAEPEPEPQLEPNTANEPETETEPHSEAEAQAQAQAQAEPQLEPNTANEPETETEPHSEAEAEAKAENEHVPEPDSPPREITRRAVPTDDIFDSMGPAAEMPTPNLLVMRPNSLEDQEVSLRRNQLVLTRGVLTWDTVHRRKMGADSGPFEIDGVPMAAARGQGVVAIQCGEGSSYHLHHLDRDGIYLREDRLVAFSRQLYWENGQIPEMGSRGPGIIRLSGVGFVGIQTPGPLYPVSVTSGEPLVFICIDALVGWGTRLVPHRIDALDGRVHVGFSGEGALWLTTPGEHRRGS